MVAKRQTIKGKGREIFFSGGAASEADTRAELQLKEIREAENVTSQNPLDLQGIVADEVSPGVVVEDVFSKLLGSPTRSRMLTWFVLKPEERFSSSQLQTIFGADASAIGREVKVFEEIGILQSETTREGRYSLNPVCDFLAELRGIILKTDGFIGRLKEVLHGHDEVKLAFIFGAFTTEREWGKNEINLLVAGSPGLSIDALYGEMPIFANPDRRAIEITYLPINEYRRRRRILDTSVIRILRQPRVWLVGEEDRS